MISPEDIQKIKEVSLVEAIGKEVELKKKGVEWVGFSPFTKERSGSFTVNEPKQIWKCFSTGKGGKTAVDFYMQLDDIPWLEACKKVAGLMNIPLNGVVPTPAAKPNFHKRPLKDGEKSGDKFFEYKDFTDSELKTLGPRISDIHCTRYHLHSVKTYTICKENEAFEISSHEEYPIFAFSFPEWQKIYQPKSENKAQRFSYAGTKPSKYVFGLDVIKTAFNARKEEIDNSEDDEDTDPRLEAAVIMSGGSDGLNMASFEYYPVWSNSETEQLEWEDYKKLKTWVKNIYYLGDLDATGVRESVKIGLKYLDINLIWLPQKLSAFKDQRGNPCKDFKDYVARFYSNDKPEVFTNSLKKLVENALPFQFWNEYWNEKKTDYYISNTKLYHFLKCIGFGRFENPNLKDGYIYVRKEGNIVRILEPYQIANFVHSFLEERQMPTALRDYVYKTPTLADKSLANLPRIEVDFTVADKFSQHFFFNDRIWRVTKDGIEDFKQGDVNLYVWEDKVVDFKPRLAKEAPFEITRDNDGDFDIVINQKDNMFFNYLINTSRVHWKKDLEGPYSPKVSKDELDYFKENQFNIAGSNLSADEILEQKLHLINKIYSIGYLLHQYKNDSKAWCVFAMDNKISDQGESHGGSGKSICYSNLNHILKRRVVLKGRNPNLTKDDFIYSSVTEDTDFILIDDCHPYLQFEFFFSEITNSMIVNPKNSKSFEIPFSKSPKLVMTSNFTPSSITPSSGRRIIYTVFSDYYHFNKDNIYRQERQVSDDFDGRNLFKDFTDKDWNDFYNFCAYCNRFFLAHTGGKISPPMDNVTKRNLITEMTSGFKDWADQFFETKEAPIGSTEEVLKYQNNFFAKDEAFSDFKNKYSPKNWTPQRFKKSLQAYCQYVGWIFNPIENGVKDGRIMQKHNGVTQEVIYIKTFPDTIEDTETAMAVEAQQYEVNNQFNVDVDLPNNEDY